MNAFTKRLKQTFAVDLRAIALLRIGVALVIILDLSIRISDLEVFYTDSGAMSLATLFSNNWNHYSFSFYTISGNWMVIAVVFMANYACAFMLLAGYRTRLATFLCWVLLLSIHNRNPMILQSGDDLLRMLLFWGMFLPWGNRYSIDSPAGSPSPASNLYFSMATLAYIIQVASVYFFTALFKNSAEWLSEGSAIYYALSLDQMVYPFGKWLYPHKELLRYMTFGVYYTELLLPIVLFIPAITSFWRYLFIIVVLIFQLGIGLCLNVGLFFVISIVAAVGLLPGTFMDRIDKAFGIKPPENRELAEGKKILPNLLALFFTVYCIVWNCGTLPMAAYALDDNAASPGRFLRIDQNWGMFAPRVLKEDGWYIFEAETNKGDVFDLNRNGEKVNYNKPAYIAGMIRNDRWRKYFENYMNSSNAWMRYDLCRYLINGWSKKHHGSFIKRLRIVYMQETTMPDYKYVKPVRIVLQECN